MDRNSVNNVSHQNVNNEDSVNKQRHDHVDLQSSEEIAEEPRPVIHHVSIVRPVARRLYGIDKPPSNLTIRSRCGKRHEGTGYCKHCKAYMRAYMIAYERHKKEEEIRTAHLDILLSYLEEMRGT